MFQNQLKNLGLSAKEANIYELLLNLGPSPITPILAGGKLKKGDTYNVLRSLKAKNLITEEKINKKTVFQAKPPQELNKLVREKEKMIELQKNELENLIPDLTSFYQTTTDKPIIQIYKGIDGLKIFYQDLQKTGQNFLIFVSKFHRKNEELENLVEEQIKKQHKAGLKLRALNPVQKIKYELTPREYLKKQLEIGAEVRYLPNEFTFPSQIFIYGNKVAIISMKNELITTMIENENIATTMKTIFEYIWQATAAFHNNIVKNDHYQE